MTMFEFMQNAFFALCGIVCIAVIFIIIYAVVVGVARAFKGGNGNGRKRD
ncbi:hypothetical protein [Anaerotruncus rubiinfantis]|nr:hypothetical protein [Anaerotruncus rubiinfantis]